MHDDVFAMRVGAISKNYRIFVAEGVQQYQISVYTHMYPTALSYGCAAVRTRGCMHTKTLT